jgi:hypothetical protein
MIETEKGKHAPERGTIAPLCQHLLHRLVTFTAPASIQNGLGNSSVEEGRLRDTLNLDARHGAAGTHGRRDEQLSRPVVALDRQQNQSSGGQYRGRNTCLKVNLWFKSLAMDVRM